ncbi:hypothetical protein G3M53_72830 [Streptomyces sp. SID7982]|nr:hypothetical protein [Streptomyces sp. SID7982]
MTAHHLPEGTVTVTEVLLRRIAAGGAIDWTQIDALRRRPGARWIDLEAVDAARAGAGR